MTASSSGPVFLDRVCRDQSAILCHSCLNILKNINTMEKKLVKLKGSIQEMLTSVLCEASSPCTNKRPGAPTCVPLVPQTKQIRLTTTGSPSAISTELYTCGRRCAQVSVAGTAPSSSSETSTAPVPLNAVHVSYVVQLGCVYIITCTLCKLVVISHLSYREKVSSASPVRYRNCTRPSPAFERVWLARLTEPVWHANVLYDTEPFWFYNCTI